MCIRRFMLSEMDISAQKAEGAKPMACEEKGNSQISQTEPKTSSLPPVLEACLGFIRGTFGFKN